MCGKHLKNNNMHCTVYLYISALIQKGLQKQWQVQSQTDFKYTILVFHFPPFYFKARFPDFIYNDGGSENTRLTQAGGGFMLGPRTCFLITTMSLSKGGRHPGWWLGAAGWLVTWCQEHLWCHGHAPGSSVNPGNRLMLDYRVVVPARIRGRSVMRVRRQWSSNAG